MALTTFLPSLFKDTTNFELSLFSSSSLDEKTTNDAPAGIFLTAEGVEAIYSANFSDNLMFFSNCFALPIVLVSLAIILS